MTKQDMKKYIIKTVRIEKHHEEYIDASTMNFSKFVREALDKLINKTKKVV